MLRPTNKEEGFALLVSYLYGYAVFVFFLLLASLTCSSDMITVILSKSYLDSLGYNENDLALNDAACRPNASNPVTFSFPFNSCGTIKEVRNHQESETKPNNQTTVSLLSASMVKSSGL